MKKVLFDLLISQPVAGSKYHGGGEYTKTVFKELCDRFLDSIELHVYYNPDLFIDEWIKVYFSEGTVISHQVYNYHMVSKLIEELQPETLFLGLLSGLDFIEKRDGMKIIGVYHGFRSLEAPTDISAPLYENTIKGAVKEWLKSFFSRAYFEKKYREQKARIDKCNEIIGVSEHSGYAARVFFPEYSKEHIHVFYSPEKYVEILPDIEKVTQERVILMLGGNRWVKNVYRGVVAIDELFTNGQLDGYMVKIVGGIPRKIKSKIQNRDRFIEYGYLSTEELEKTYKSCDIFFYPSLNEGFGYPPQEVMKYGKTCVISAISSLVEIYGDSVYYCNPYDLNEIKCRLIQASEEKIPEAVINDRMKIISQRQSENLKSLCKLIID